MGGGRTWEGGKWWGRVVVFSSLTVMICFALGRVHFAVGYRVRALHLGNYTLHVPLRHPPQLRGKVGWKVWHSAGPD